MSGQNSRPEADMMRMLAEFRLPGMPHMEILQQSMSEMSQAMQTMAGAQDPQARATKQAEMLKTAYERAVGNMREVADLIQKSNAEALSLLNQRFTEAMDEVKTMTAKTG